MKSMRKKMSSVSILKHARKVTPNYLVSSPWTPRLLLHFLSALQCEVYSKI